MLSKHPLRNRFYSLKNACYNPRNKAYKYYGAKGIKIYEDWLGEGGFARFVQWADENLGPIPLGYEMDRWPKINGDFKPGNIRFTEKKTNCNTRNTNQYWTYKGKTKSNAEWARLYKINPRTLWARIHDLGYTIHQALTLPLQPGNHR